MQYMGSKSKMFKYIYPIIKKEISKENIWIEPFVGGCNMIDKVKDFPVKFGIDNNFYLISMWKALQEGWKPPTTLTRQEYHNVKDNKKDYSPELVGFAGFLCSFGGKWFNGYAFNNKGDNYALRGSNVLLKQVPLIKDIFFVCSDYSKIKIYDNSIVYCDPPYENTTNYKDTFNHKNFWNWCRKVSETNRIFISEYSAPSDFTCILTVEHKTILNKNSQDLRIEKLFTIGD